MVGSTHYYDDSYLRPHTMHAANHLNLRKVNKSLSSPTKKATKSYMTMAFFLSSRPTPYPREQSACYTYITILFKKRANVEGYRGYILWHSSFLPTFATKTMTATATLSSPNKVREQRWCHHAMVSSRAKRGISERRHKRENLQTKKTT